MEFILLLSILPAIFCTTTEYDGYDPTGGVSQANKLKIVDTYKAPSCSMETQEHDKIFWNYKGLLLDGHVFDSGQFRAQLGHHDVITGVDKGMRGLCVGDKRRMTMHSDWAYGEKGVPGTIPPQSTLIFDVELLSIERPGVGKVTKDDIISRKEPEESVDDGGVSKENKLKLEDTYKSDGEKCSLTSQEDDTIHWKYKGLLLDGHVFDSGEFTATLGHHDVIAGVDEGMRGLCVGDKRKMTMHSDLAYGDDGIGGTIPPKATLIFEVELLSIERPDGRSAHIDDLKEGAINPKTGLPDGEKLKIEVTHKVDCTIRSQEDDTIHWYYKGTFLDGTEFHSGDFHATLGHGHVITGVDKGMRGMCEGEKRRLIIHSDWAYGDTGRHGSIPPKATLIFDVEMKKIDRPDPSKSEL